MTTFEMTTLVGVAADVFAAAGVDEPAARSVAEALVEADARGIGSHGLMLVPMYVDRLLVGSVSTLSEATVVLDLEAVAVLDAGDALGVLTGDQAMALAVQKAEQFGVGVVTVRHAFHFGGAFRFVQSAMDAGCIGIAAANTRPLMPAPGGATAVVGNNPLAIGVPGPDPIVVDMALSEAALGKIRLAASDGRTISPTWATGPDGMPTTDPETALAGLLLPTGGPKGYGLALVVDVLSGVLSGGSFGAGVKGLYADVKVPNDCSHVFIALDPGVFGTGDDFDDRIEELGRQVGSSRLAPGVETVLLPGQRERENAELARKEGVTVSDSVLAALRATAERLGVDIPEVLR